MKIRLGFVSNSSTSSFICCVCGEQEAGFELCLSDIDMVECVNGHTICQDELLMPFQKEDEGTDIEEEWPYEIPEKYCPVCNFILFSDENLSNYLLKKYNIPREEAFSEIKSINKRRRKLYDPEYNMYVCTKLNLNRDFLLQEVKDTYKTFKDFKKFINQQ